MAAQDRHTSAFKGFGEIGADRLHQVVGVIGDLLAFKPNRCSVDSKAGQMFVIGQLTHLATGGQQGLRGNTTAVDAGTTHVAGLNDRGPETVFGGMFSGIKTAVAGTDHDDVEVEAGVAHRGCCVVAVIVALRRSSSNGTAQASHIEGLNPFTVGERDGMGALRLETWMQTSTFCSENQHGLACPVQIPVGDGRQWTGRPWNKRGNHLMTTDAPCRTTGVRAGGWRRVLQDQTARAEAGAGFQRKSAALSG